MILPFLKPSLITGIDIQPDSVYLARLRRANSQFLLEKLASLPLPPAVGESNMTNWDKLTAILFDWVRALNLVGEQVVAALPAKQVRLFRVPASVAMGEVAVRRYVEQTFPGLNDRLAVDYSVLPGVSSEIVIAAAKRDEVDQYATCLQDAGLQIHIMDIDMFAIQRAMQRSEGAILWQQRHYFKLIWQDDDRLPQQLQWPARQGEQAIADLYERLAQHRITQLLFCGSHYYVELFQQTTTLPAVLSYFSPHFICHERNVADYLLAIGLAMRAAPAW